MKKIWKIRKNRCCWNIFSLNSNLIFDFDWLIYFDNKLRSMFILDLWVKEDRPGKMYIYVYIESVL